MCLPVPVIALVWRSVTERGEQDEQEQSLKSHSERERILLALPKHKTQHELLSG